MRRLRSTTLVGALREDLETIVDRDPSIGSLSEAMLHPALPAVWAYRVANPLHPRGRRRLAWAVAQLGKIVSGGVEIHTGAAIGRRFFIDHGAGVVIGETAEIGDDVTFFHQVTLGSAGWWHDQEEGARRHPRIGNRVVIGANATVLGPISTGDECTIGAQALVLDDVPSRSRVLAPASQVREARSKTGGDNVTVLRSSRAPGGTHSASRSVAAAFPVW